MNGGVTSGRSEVDEASWERQVVRPSHFVRWVGGRMRSIRFSPEIMPRDRLNIGGEDE